MSVKKVNINKMNSVFCIVLLSRYDKVIKKRLRNILKIKNIKICANTPDSRLIFKLFPIRLEYFITHYHIQEIKIYKTRLFLLFIYF